MTPRFRVVVCMAVVLVVSVGLLAPAKGSAASAASASSPVAAPNAPSSQAGRPLDPADQAGKRRSRTELGRQLDPAAVAYYTKRFTVSVAVARERLIDQNLVIGLPSVMKERVGDGLGSVTYDNSSGRWVASATTQEARSRAEDLFDELDLSARPKVVEARVDASTALATARRITRELANRGLGADAGLSAAGDSVTVVINRDASAQRRATIRDAVEGTRGATPAQIEERALANSPTIACSFPFCDTLVAGTQWVDANTACTMAFYVGPPNGTFGPHMLTAGHCLNTNEEWYTCAPACRPYNTGTQSTRNYAGSIGIFGSDSGILRVDAHYGARAGGWTLYPGYWNWSVGTLSTVRAYYPFNTSAYHNNNAGVGLIVCKNGRSTRSTCGEIIDNFYDVKLNDPPNGDPNVTSMLRIRDMCTVGGDSGSPVTAAASETAVGIVSAGNAVNDNTACNPAGPETIVEPVGRALTQLNVVIYGG